MVTFLLGIILGGIVGVWFQLIWRKFEQIVRINIEPTFFYGSGDNGQIEMQLMIQNVGTYEIPDYNIRIVSPDLNFTIGTPSAHGALLPGQLRFHRIPLDTGEKLVSYCRAVDGLTSESHCGTYIDEISNSDPPYGSRFELWMENSDLVLFTNSKIGDAILYSLTHYPHASLELGHHAIRYNERENGLRFSGFLDTLYR